MAYKYEYVNVVGSMSIRPAPNTSNDPLGSLPVNVKGYGNELYLYPSGDKWVRIEQGGTAAGWVAVVHAGKPYGTLTEITVVPPVEPPASVFPQTFTLTDEAGKSAEYAFVREL
jgi:hypothetical protein